MSKMKEIAIDVDEIMTEINDRIVNESPAYGRYLMSQLICELSIRIQTEAKMICDQEDE